MQKILLAITCLTITTAFANCDIYVSSYVNSNKLESGSLVHYDFDNLYDVYHSSSISLNAINDNYYVLGSRGDDFDCNTINYKGNPAFTIKLLPYCKTQINSKTIIKKPLQIRNP